MTSIFLTGATGVMGWAGMEQILQHADYRLRILARPSQQNRRKLAPLMRRVEVVWGDLTCYEDVLRGVSGADVVLHVGGMVSPAADYYPQTTRRVNITAAQHIVRAVLAQPVERQPRVVYIGSVAQLGDHLPPAHWGRTGDPVCISPYDHYGISKAVAERIIADSGIRRWVSLRQSGILHPGILKHYDPIMFHVPIHGVLEWATVDDSGRLLANVCDPAVPDEFWNRFYNISSGPDYRLTNYEFESMLLRAIGCPPPERVFKSRWFATRNFHGEWYLDSDVLESYLHFRQHVPVGRYFEQMAQRLPRYFRLARYVPAPLLRLAMRPMAYKRTHGTQDWIRRGNTTRIAAYYGSLDKYYQIADWKDQDLSRPSDTPLILDHGYDEQKPHDQLTLADLRQAAAFRGGECLSSDYLGWNALHEWRCHDGHRFLMSPNLVLAGGHWCPDCMPTPWNYDQIALHNPFLAQQWYAVHGRNERNYYTEHVFDGWKT